MYCLRCGTPLFAGSEVCRGCGTVAVSGSVESPGPAADSVPQTTAPRSLPTRTAPPPSPTRLADPDAPFDKEVWAAAIGPRNTEYYLRRFEARLARRSLFQWNWSAFFVTVPWLIYRKMPGWALAYLLASLLAIPLMAGTIAVALSFADLDVALGIPILLINALILAFLVVPPMFANSLYFSHCRALIRKEASRAENRETLLAKVARTGGTRAAWLIALVCVLMALVVLIAYAVAIQMRQGY